MCQIPNNLPSFSRGFDYRVCPTIGAMDIQIPTFPTIAPTYWGQRTSIGAWSPKNRSTLKSLNEQRFFFYILKVHPPIYTLVHAVMLHVNKGDYKHWTGDPRTWGPEDRGPEDPASWGLCCNAAVTVQLDKQSVLMPQTQTHGYVLDVILLSSYAPKGIIYSRQRYFISSDLFDPQCSLLHTQSESLKIHLHVTFDLMTFDPGTLHTASHPSSLARNKKKDYSWVCRVKKG